MSSLLSTISALPQRTAPTGPVSDEEKRVVFNDGNLSLYKKRGIMVDYEAPLFSIQPEFSAVMVDKMRLSCEAYMPGADAKYPIGPRSVFYSAKVYKVVLVDLPDRSDVARLIGQWIQYLPIPVDLLKAAEENEKGARKISFTLHFSASAQKNLAEFLERPSALSAPTTDTQTAPATFLETTPFSPAKPVSLTSLANTRR
jgi:hypothetical protein